MKMLLPVLLMLATGKTILPGEVKVKTLPPESREVLDYLPWKSWDNWMPVRGLTKRIRIGPEKHSKA